MTDTDAASVVSRPSGFSEDEELTLPNAKYDMQLALRQLKVLARENETIWATLERAIQKISDLKSDVTIEGFLKMLMALQKKSITGYDQLREYYQKTATYDPSSGLVQLYKNLQYKFALRTRLPDPNVAPDPLTLSKMKLLVEAGVGLTSYESYQMMIALRRTCEVNKVAKARFWGKIWGMEKDYYVIEVDPHPDDIKIARERDMIQNDEQRVTETAEKISKALEVALNTVEDLLRGMKEEVVAIKEGIVMSLTSPERASDPEVPLDKVEEIDPIAAQQLLVKYVMPPIPQPSTFREIIVPSEPLGEGVNCKRYYVANEPWHDFVLLPEVTPAHIVTARCIRKFLTGNLDAEVLSFPPFPGRERHLLRAQLARISSGAIVAPAGVYLAHEGEEEFVDEDELLPGGISENPDYHPPPVKSLVDSLRDHWQHIRQYILPQGRTTYWKPPSMGFGEYEWYEDWDEDELRGRLGPPILSAISRDDSPEVDKCWSVRRSYRTMGNQNCIMVRSNAWPGAAAVARGYLWENIYIGWGVKHLALPHSPPFPLKPWIEYEDGPEVMEKPDPTPLEEEAWRKRHGPNAALQLETHDLGEMDWEEEEEGEEE